MNLILNACGGLILLWFVLGFMAATYVKLTGGANLLAVVAFFFPPIIFMGKS